MLSAGGMFGSAPASLNTGGGSIFGQPSQPSLFGGSFGQQPAQSPGLSLAPYGQQAQGQQVALPGVLWCST